MGKYRVTIEINLKKLAIIAGMVLATYLGIISGEGETLLLIIPAGLYSLVSKEV